MVRNTGFQLGFPECVVPPSSNGINSRAMNAWRWAQVGIASLAVLLLSPVFLVMWILVRATSPGPFLFTQTRPGKNGVPFKIYKVRTMRAGAEKKTALGVTNTNPQVTAIGRILRTLKLDELPQLWNVARGEMALVGPRPIPAALDNELREKIPGFELRYSVRPGLTSIGQICVNDNAVGEQLVADWSLRFEGELHYLRNRCVRYDLLMLFMTALYVARKFLKR
jgi:lipopolysaccharide/colanic/teichoic acid biosynthesis glycosyltransferase